MLCHLFCGKPSPQTMLIVNWIQKKKRWNLNKYTKPHTKMIFVFQNSDYKLVAILLSPWCVNYSSTFQPISLFQVLPL